MVYVHTNQHLNLYFFAGSTSLYLDDEVAATLLLEFDQLNQGGLASKQVDEQEVELLLACQSCRQLLVPKYQHRQ